MMNEGEATETLRARLTALARIGAEHEHWTVGDGWIQYGDGHDPMAPHDCSHPDCRLVREAALLREPPITAPRDTRLDWFLRADYADVMEALAEDGSLLDNIRDEIRAAAPEEGTKR